jgi:hypothetical protein
MSPIDRELGSVKFDSISVRRINELFVNILICSNIKRDILI